MSVPKEGGAINLNADRHRTAWSRSLETKRCNMKEEMPWIKKASSATDQCNDYHETQALIAFRQIGDSTGIRIIEHGYSEVGEGKDVVDMKCGQGKMDLAMDRTLLILCPNAGFDRGFDRRCARPGPTRFMVLHRGALRSWFRPPLHLCAVRHVAADAHPVERAARDQVGGGDRGRGRARGQRAAQQRPLVKFYNLQLAAKLPGIADRPLDPASANREFWWRPLYRPLVGCL